MKIKYFILVLIIVLSLSNVAFGQTIIILKSGRSIEVESLKYENNRWICYKDGKEFSIFANLVVEIYVLNKGTIYPPPSRKRTESQDTKTFSDTEKTYELNNEAKKAEDTKTSNDEKEVYELNSGTKRVDDTKSISDAEEPVEQTYIYKPPLSFFQCKIPKSWKYFEKGGVHMFSPFSFDGDFDKTTVKILRKFGKGSINKTSISKEFRIRLLPVMEQRGDRVLAERVRKIDGFEAWEILYESERYKPIKMHEIWLIRNGFLILISLEASPELFDSADRQFEKIIESLDFL